jgi:hypothetical protein
LTPRQWLGAPRQRVDGVWECSAGTHQWITGAPINVDALLTAVCTGATGRGRGYTGADYMPGPQGKHLSGPPEVVACGCLVHPGPPAAMRVENTSDGSHSCNGLRQNGGPVNFKWGGGLAAPGDTHGGHPSSTLQCCTCSHTHQPLAWGVVAWGRRGVCSGRVPTRVRGQINIRIPVAPVRCSSLSPRAPPAGQGMVHNSGG